MFVVSVLASLACLALLFTLIYRLANNLSLAFSGCAVAVASVMFFCSLIFEKYETKHVTISMDKLLFYSIGFASVLAFCAVISEVARLTVNNLNNTYESTDKE